MLVPKIMAVPTKYICIIYLQGLVDGEKLDNLTQHIVETKAKVKRKHSMTSIRLFLSLKTKKFIHTSKRSRVFKGQPLLFISESTTAYSLNMSMTKQRSLSEPTTEKVVRGPKIALIENLDENLGLLRQRSTEEEMVIEDIYIGNTKEHRTSIVFHNKHCQTHIVNQVREKLLDIPLDNIQDSGMIEEFLEEAPYSPFPQVQNTERPDRVLAAVNEGRVAILVDGSPFALLVPTTFDMIMKSPDDYYERWIAGSLLRLLRYLSILLPYSFQLFIFHSFRLTKVCFRRS